MPENQSRRHFRLDAEKAQLLAQLAMVSLARLFDSDQIDRPVLFACEEGSAVNPLELLPILVSSPVAPGNGEKFEDTQLLGFENMRPGAKIDELSQFIGGENLIRSLFDQLALELLTLGPKGFPLPLLWTECWVQRAGILSVTNSCIRVSILDKSSSVNRWGV